MSEQTSTTQREKLATSLNADGTLKNRSTELITNEQIENTPFKIHGIENEWFITLGDYRITQNYLTKDEAIKHLETHKWNVVLQMIGTALDRFDEKEWNRVKDKNSQRQS